VNVGLLSEGAGSHCPGSAFDAAALSQIAPEAAQHPQFWRRLVRTNVYSRFRVNPRKWVTEAP